MRMNHADLDVLSGAPQHWVFKPQLSRMPTTVIEQVLDAIPNAIFVAKDVNLRCVAANRAMLGLCGVKRREELIGRTAADFFADDVRERYEALDRRVMRTGVSPQGSLGLSAPKRAPSVVAMLPLACSGRQR